MRRINDKPAGTARGSRSRSFAPGKLQDHRANADRTMQYGPLRYLGAISVLAVSYFAAAKLGLIFAIPPGNATAVWPPSGLALAAVLLLGPRAVWGVWLGAFAVTVSTGVSPITAFVVGAGNSIEALLAVWLFRGRIDPDSPFDRLTEVFQFAMVAGISPVTAATIGTAALVVGGYLPMSGLVENWSTWWLGDATGIMVVTPLFLTIFKKNCRSFGDNRWPVTVLPLAVLLLLSQIIFGGWLPGHTAKVMLYLPVIFLIWVALKFRLCEVAIAIAIFSGAAIWGASRGVGAFGHESLQQSLFDLQLFIGLYAVTGLAMAGLVTHRRMVVKDLQNMKFALDQSAIVAITDPAGKINYVNDRFCDISRFTREEMLGVDHRITNSGYHPREFFDGLWRTIHGGRIWRGEIQNRAKDGSLYWTDSTIVPLLDEHAGSKQYLSISFDITERKTVNEQFHRLFQAVEKTTDIVFIADRDGKIEYVNPAFEATTGYRRAEALGQTPRILKSGQHEYRYYERLWSTILAGNVHRATTVNRKKSGELFHAEQTITPVKDGDGNITHFVSVLKDITELLRTQEQKIAMRLAREVQQQYYGATASVHGFDIAGAAYPADETGGDYFDFITMPDGRLGIVIADVSGHGISAALVMAETRACLRSYSLTCRDAGTVLSHVNRVLAADLTSDRFVTLFLACLDPHTRTLTYASAGHETGYLLDQAADIRYAFESTGPPLGILDSVEYQSSRPIQLTPGRVMLLLTDGVTEALAHDGKEFGPHQAIAYLQAHMHEPARRIADGLNRAVLSYSANRRLQDDVSSVVIKTL